MSDITAPLLKDNEPVKPESLKLEDVVQDEEVKENKEKQEEKEPPYSVRNEISFFYKRGIPLALSCFLEWGIPPWFSMLMAGRTSRSIHLQTALGYSRVFYNITLLMVMLGLTSYFSNVLPGCIGAERHDRIPMYFWRSVSLVLICASPFFILQFFSAPIMAKLGVDMHTNATAFLNASEHVNGHLPPISEEVGLYTRLMVITAVLLVLEIHLEQVFINLGYVKSAAVNSLVTGLGVDMACTWLFIYHLDLGIFGVALVQMTVRGVRCLVWCFYATIYGKWGVFCNCCRGGEKAEAFLTKKEFKVFLKLSIPAILGCFGGWFIFELQIMALSHIKDISQAAIAAGAIWVQSESVIASIQTGWIVATKVRVMNLMGAQDKGAPKAFVILCLLSAGMVLVTNVPLIAASHWIGKIVSNDPSVQQWFTKIVWLLALHSQTRITCSNMNCLFIAFGKPILGNIIVYGSFYVLSAPLAGAIALTDWFTESVLVKLAMCLGTSILAQLYMAIIASFFLWRFDWNKIAAEIAARANTDKKTPTPHGDKSPSDSDMASPTVHSPKGMI